MSWLRKSVAYLLSLVLLASLLGLAISIGTNDALSEPSKVEKMLDESKLYDNFAVYATEQAQKIAAHETGVETGTAVPPQDPAVKEAAAAIFSPQFLRELTNKVLDSNYAWLQGKTEQPDFTVNMTGPKQDFAKRVGEYITQRMSGLPVCTPAQLAQLPSPAEIDWLTIDCRPPTLTAQAAGAAVAQQIAGSGSFLDNPEVTEQSIGSKGSGDKGEPYYVKLSGLPGVYQFSQKLPLIAGIVALLCVLGIVFIHPTRRTGLKLVGIVLLIAGVLLAWGKIISDFIFNKLDKTVFDSSSTGPLQHSLVDFTHRVQRELVTINLYFAVAYLLLGAALLLWWWRRKPAAVVVGTPPETAEPLSTPAPAPPKKKRPLIQ